MRSAQAMIKETTGGDTNDWFERLARLGYAARGLVYSIVGSFAIAAAFRSEREVGDSRDALAYLIQQPFGKVILLITGVGLIGYCIWQLIRAVKDPEGVDGGAKAVLRRIGYVASLVIHAGLALTAFRLLQGQGSISGDEQAQSWTARLMLQPFGRGILIAVGCGITAFAFREFFTAWKANFMKYIRRHEVPENTLHAVKVIGRLGHIARGIVMLIVGIFVVISAVRFDPSEIRGVGGALRVLQEQPFGPTLIGIVGLGLLCFGIFNFVNARYRTIHPQV